MTRKQLAQKIKKAIESKEHPGVKPSVYLSSSYGVCKEMLGECTPEELQHTQTRDGIGYMMFFELFPREIRNSIKNYHSLRDIFNVLPP